MKRVSIVIITSRFPFPLEKGDKLRIYHQIKDLSNYYDLFLISINTETKVNHRQINELKKYCRKVFIIKLSVIDRIINIIKAWINKEPLQIGYFYSKKAHKKVKYIIDEIQPNWIYSQLIRTSKYTQAYENNIIDYMDTFSKGIERRIHTFPRIIQPFIRREFYITQKYETDIFSHFKHHTIITENDRNFIKHTNNHKINIVPNGVDTHYFKEKAKQNKKFDLVFVGNMNYPPNIEAAIYLCEEILPIIQKKQTCTVLIGGTNPNKRVKKLASNNITISGWVEDIRDVYSTGRLFVAPMFIGTGLQNKLLEAMSMGIPCITTQLANRALLANESEIIIKNDAQGFADACINLLKNKKKYQEISIKGRSFVQKKYDWRNMNQKLRQIFNSK